MKPIILRGLSTATPPLYATQEEAYEFFSTHFPLKPAEQDLYRRILLDRKIKGGMGCGAAVPNLEAAAGFSAFAALIEFASHETRNDTERPIYLQHEAELHEHYQWPWRGGCGCTFGTTPLPLSVDDVSAGQEASASGRRDDPHLRSTRHVTSYHIHATDGEIGHVEDFIVDDENWAIRFLVVDTRNWLSGKKVLLSPQWINRVEWTDSSVHFEATRESVKNGREFDPSKGFNRDYEAYLYDHYGRPVHRN